MLVYVVVAMGDGIIVVPFLVVAKYLESVMTVGWVWAAGLGMMAVALLLVWQH